jgi:CDP-paratose 2-epimerase
LYQFGGGYENSCSIIEALAAIQKITGQSVETEEGPVRKADHRCYWTNNSQFQEIYPNWRITRTLDGIMQELLA